MPTNSDTLDELTQILIDANLIYKIGTNIDGDHYYLESSVGEVNVRLEEALTALTEREERIKREAKIEELRPLLDAFIEVGGFSRFVRQLNSHISELTKNTKG